VKRYPLAFGAGITGIKTCAVDIIVQKQVEKRKDIDWKRAMTFGSFGLCFCGVWQYYLHNKIFPVLTPGTFKFAKKSMAEKMRDMRGIKNVGIKLFVDMGINSPFLFFPSFYIIKESFRQGRVSVLSALKVYRENFWQDVPAIWSVWLPAQTINFAFSPSYMRVPFVAVISVGWTAYISMTRGECDEHKYDSRQV